MKVICCQSDIIWENRAENFARIRRMLSGGAVTKGALVILPEMFAMGFTMNIEAAREGTKAESEQFLSELARELGVWIMAGLVRGNPGELARNEAVIFDPSGKEVAHYCKMQPFSSGGEGKHYQAGPGIVTFQWGELTVAPFVCYDLRFPELFRAAVRQGAQFFPVIASWPVMRIGHWITLLQARAIENLAFVAGVNRVGTDPHFLYTGHSMIVDPHGKILAEAGESEGIIEADLDVTELVAWRKKFPALQDMREDMQPRGKR